MDESKKILKEGSSLLEKIMDFRYFTLFLTVIFALDIFCLVAYKKNILFAFNNTNVKNIELVQLLVFVVFFGFVMTVFFPVLRYVLRSILLYIPRNNKFETKGNDYKYLFSAKKQAIATRNSFELSLVEKEEFENRNTEKELGIFFALGILVITDYIINQGSITNYFYTLLQQETGFLYFIYNFMLTLFILTIIFWFYASLKPYDLETIYLPDMEE